MHSGLTALLQITKIILLERQCAPCNQRKHFFPFTDSFPQQDEHTRALLTSCHTEEHSCSFAHHCPQPHNPRNLHSIEVALNFRNSWASCYRLWERNTDFKPDQHHLIREQGIKRPCLAKSNSTVRLVWCFGAESVSTKDISYQGCIRVSNGLKPYLD